MAMDINKVRSRLNSLQNQTQKQDLIWKPPVGKSTVRIVPYKFNKDNPFIELLFHYNLAGKTYLSPATFGRPDPILEFAEQLRSTGTKDDYKLAKTLEPKLRTFAPVIVRGEEDKGVKFWGFGKTIYQELLSIIADADYGDITDPASGRDITVEFKSAKETGKDYPSISIRVKPDKTMLVTTKEAFQKILDSQREIVEIYKELSYEQLKTVLENWLKPENGGQSAVDETKKSLATAKVSSLPVASSLEDIGDEFDKLFNQ